MELLQKVKEVGITDEQRKKIYAYANHATPDMLDEVCPALFEICLNSAKGALKNELGRVLFHLQKNERLNTKIGLEKLVDACLIVNPEELFQVLDTSGPDSKRLGEQIKSALAL
jgi:hypothetical protein